MVRCILRQAVGGIHTNKAIQIFPKGSREYEKLVKAAHQIEKTLGSTFKVTVRNTSFDFGAGITWTTMLATHTSNPDTPFQFLYPDEQFAILFGKSTEREQAKEVAITRLRMMGHLQIVRKTYSQ